MISFSDIPERFVTLKYVYLGPEHRRYVLERVRPFKGTMFLLKFAGIDDMNAAEHLRNQDLCIPLAELAKLPPDSYYQHDILGLRVARLNDETVGMITEIITTGSNDVYVVKNAVGKQFLIPAIKEVIKQIDLVRRVMYIDPMEGLLDEEVEE